MTEYSPDQEAYDRKSMRSSTKAMNGKVERVLVFGIRTQSETFSKPLVKVAQ